MNPADRTRTVSHLVSAAGSDWTYADLYLERAEELIETLLPRERWLAARGREQSRSQITENLRRAATRGDWLMLSHLMEREEGALQQPSESRELLVLGDRIHGKRELQATPLVVALASDSPPRGGEGARDALGRLRAELRRLAQLDVEWAALYAARAAELRPLAHELAARAAEAPLLDPTRLSHEILDAIDNGDFQQVGRLAASALDQQRRSEAAMVEDTPGRLAPERDPAPPSASSLARPLPEEAVHAADELGLSAVSLPDDSAARGCLWNGIVDSERPKRMEILRLLSSRPFVTSGGVRYLPSFHPEWMLVETHPESPDIEAGPLLERLSLPSRRGLSHETVSDALLRRGPGVVRSLGLDAREYRLVSIPFDVYLRLAPKLGWGVEERWTHFDGYQMTREGRLLATAGGDVRFGGPDDLCSFARRYASPALHVRLAVVRRARLQRRSGAPAANA